MASLSAAGRPAEAFGKWGGRPTLLAVAVMNLITGLYFGATIAPSNFGADSGLYRACAVRLAEGASDFCGFLYSPLTEVVALPLAMMPATAAMTLMTLIGAAIIVVGAALETRGHALVDRVLVAIAALTFVPVVYELLLGQTTMLIAASMYPIARRSDGFRNGILLGIALALAPKPMLLPFLAWMLVWRRQALLSTVITALVLTASGVALLGVDQYRDWVLVLAGAGQDAAAGTFRLSQAQTGNLSVWPLTPARALLACAVGVASIWMIWRHPSRGFVASLFAGLLLAPYTLLYAYSILLIAVKPALAFAPRATRVLALTANLAAAFVGVFTAWAVAGLAACVSFSRPGPSLPGAAAGPDEDEPAGAP